MKTFFTLVLTIVAMSCGEKSKPSTPSTAGQQSKSSSQNQGAEKTKSDPVTSGAEKSSAAQQALGDGFLTAEDISAPKVAKTLSKESMIDELYFVDFASPKIASRQSDTQAEASSDESTSNTSEESCEDVKDVIKATKNQVIIESERSAKLCGEEANYVEEHKIHYKLVVTCDKGDFSGMNGKVPTSEEMKQYSPIKLCAGGKGTYFSQSKITLVMKDKQNTKASREDRSTHSINATMTKDGKPCSFEVKGDEVHFVKGCTEVVKRSASALEKKSGDQDSYRFSDWGTIIEREGQDFPIAGSKQLVIGDWKGTLTFEPGMPKVELSNGKETVKETLKVNANTEIASGKEE